IGKAFGQMQLAAAALDPGIDPFAIAGRFFMRVITTQVREMFAPQRGIYRVQKLRLRLSSLLDSLEKLTGARPGFEPKVVFRGTERLEDTIRRGARRLSTAVVSTAAFLVCGFTAGFGHAAAWIPALFGAVGGLFALLLLVDFVHRAG
ncbi:MAG TPA: hypothetical protein VJU79_08405, partial [Candidatus Dormibacteraeota bacterium]|nr:hypothetical protein [Candidatus Dormibacteraeota bacterium]